MSLDICFFCHQKIEEDQPVFFTKDFAGEAVTAFHQACFKNKVNQLTQSEGEDEQSM